MMHPVQILVAPIGKRKHNLCINLVGAYMNQPLANQVDVQAGHPFRGSVPEDPKGDAFALQMRDVGPEGVADWHALTRTSLEKHKSADWLRQGDVLFVARGMRNYALCLDDVPVPAVCSQYFFLLRVRSAALLPEFLAWQINRAPAQRYLARNAEGSDQLSIRRGVLESLPIVVPALERQAHIVALARVAAHERWVLDALIRNRERQLDALAIEMHNLQTLSR